MNGQNRPTMITTVLQVHLYNNRTHRYTPVTREEPPSHGTTVYVEIPPTYNIYAGSSRCVIVSQSLQNVATDVHDVLLSTADNTFHFYGICLNWNRKLNLANAHYGNKIKRPFWPSDTYSSNRTNRRKLLIYRYVVKYYLPIIYSVNSVEAVLFGTYFWVLRITAPIKYQWNIYALRPFGR